MGSSGPAVACVRPDKRIPPPFREPMGQMCAAIPHRAWGEAVPLHDLIDRRTATHCDSV